MNLISLCIAFFFTLSAFAYPIGFKGQKTTASQYSATVNAPNNTVTNLGASASLIETGNTNLLANPSFEHSTFSTSWTFSGTATASKETSVLIDGNASYKIVASSQTYDLSQTSTLYAAQLGGTQGVVTVWIDSSDTIGQLCAVVDSVDTNCVTIESSATWKEYVIPFVMGSTSNGLRIKASSTTGTVYIDNAFVGAMPATMTPEISQAQVEIVGNIGGANTALTTVRSSYFEVTNASLDMVLTKGVARIPCSTTNPATGLTCAAGDESIGLNFISKAGDYEVCMNFSSQVGASSLDSVLAYQLIQTANSAQTIIQEGLSRIEVGGNAPASNDSQKYPVNICGYFSFSEAGEKTIRLMHEKPFSTTHTIVADRSASTGQRDISFTVKYFPPKSKIYSQQCTSSLGCENVFSAKVSSAGVVSDENLDWINGNCTNANPRVCTFNTSIFTVAPNCSCSVSSPSSSGDNDCAATVTSTTVSAYTSSSNAGSQQAINIICQKQGVDFKEKNVITGTFANVMTVPNISRPKTCYYAFGGAGATLASPTVCAASPCVEVYDSCSAGTPPTRATTGEYDNLTFANGTWKANTAINCTWNSYKLTSNQVLFYMKPLSTNTWTTDANGGYNVDFFTVDINGSQGDSFTMVTCTADAP